MAKRHDMLHEKMRTFILARALASLTVSTALAAGGEITFDPDCVLYYDFETTNSQGRIVNLANMQHIFNQCSRLHGEVGVHLLKGRIVACGQIKTFNTVITGNADIGCSIVVIGLQLPLATETQQHHKNQ